jgi:CubicO group peptidase (beta-lactamase class C family)
MQLYTKLSALLAEKARSDAFSGVVLVQRGEERLFGEALGYANRSWRIFNTLETRFRIASISKMFTAVAVLRLIEDGRLSLETRVVEALGLERTRLHPEVTVYHLLTMTGGIPDWFDENEAQDGDWEALLRTHPLYLLRDNPDYLPLFAGKEPVAEPGAGFRYSNASYLLLGMLIERASGEPWKDYIQREVLDRAGMASSGFFSLEENTRRTAEGYIPLPGPAGRPLRWKKNLYEVTPAPAADGGATATAEDLLRFLRALRRGELLSPEMTRAALSPKVLETPERHRGYIWMYGFGCEFLLDEAGEVVRYGHTGEESGVSCRLYSFPCQEIDVVILGNQSGCAAEIAWPVHEMILKEA